MHFTTILSFLVLAISTVASAATPSNTIASLDGSYQGSGLFPSSPIASTIVMSLKSVAVPEPDGTFSTEYFGSFTISTSQEDSLSFGLVNGQYDPAAARFFAQIHGDYPVNVVSLNCRVNANASMDCIWFSSLNGVSVAFSVVKTE